MKISMKLVYQYMAIFIIFSLTLSHLHPLLVENCDRPTRCWYCGVTVTIPVDLAAGLYASSARMMAINPDTAVTTLIRGVVMKRRPSCQ